jgi:fumarate reductase subunit C
MTFGSFYDLRFFLVIFLIFFTLCSIIGVVALAVQNKQPWHIHL